jgi:GNAT superfamily N-acetyltransferase
LEYRRGEYLLTTDPGRLEVEAVHKFLSEESYWARERPREVVEKALLNSLCFTMLRAGSLAGFARVVTDYATFSYICDLFVLREHRGKGLGKWLVECIISHTRQLGLKSWLLATADAHGLYAQYGFEPLEGSVRYMARREK